jgi:hypothetical protein
MEFFRPIFCDKDPEQAARSLDNALLIEQIELCSMLLMGCESVIYDRAHTQQQLQSLPADRPDFIIPPGKFSIAMSLATMGAVDWALGSEAAWRWLTLYALTMQTEAVNRKCPHLVFDHEIIIHRCFTRIEMYSPILRGAKRKHTDNAPGFPRTTPNDLGGNNIIQQTRRYMMMRWTHPQHPEPSWGNATPPSWMAVVGRKHSAQVPNETLVDRSSLQA